MNASDRLADVYVTRQLILQRLAAGEQVAMNKQLEDIANELERLLQGTNLTEYKVRRLNTAVNELMKAVNIRPPSFEELAELEGEFVFDTFGELGVNAALPSPEALEKVAKSALIQGETISGWFGRLNESTRFELQRAVKLGVSLGETNAQIAKRILSSSERGTEVLAKTRRDAVAIVRTSVQTVANEVRQATFQENADLLKGVQWLSTLDSRTTDICAARSGLVWTLPDYEPKGHSVPWLTGPPAHWNCRSTTIPVLKELEELGLDAKKLSPAKRSSMDGQVAADLTFDDFLKSKPDSFADEMLGAGRAEMWRKGIITLPQLLDQRGNPLTLKQLRARYGRPKPEKKPAPPPPARSSEPEFDLTSDAGRWHQASFAQNSRLEGRRVAKSLEDIEVQTSDKGAYASLDRLINMSARSHAIDKAGSQDTWRHELGHIFDARQGRQAGHSNRIGKSRNYSFYRSDAPDFVAAREADAKALLTAAGQGRKSAATVARQKELSASYEGADMFAAKAQRGDFHKSLSSAGLEPEAFEGMLRDITDFFESGGYSEAANRQRLSRAITAHRLGDFEVFINELGIMGTMRRSNLEGFKTTRAKGSMWGQLSDLAGSITRNKVAGYNRSGWGHSNGYFSRMGLSVEAYANLYSAFTHSNPMVWELVEHFTPEMAKLFKKDIEAWLKKLD